MLDNPGYEPGMKEDRAEEIIQFIETGAPTKLGSMNSSANLKNLAEIAYDSIGKAEPADFDNLIKARYDSLGQKKPRIGLDLSLERAEHLFESLFGSEQDPHFRDGDSPTIIRSLFRKALAQVAEARERHSGEDHSDIMQAGEYLLKEKYPLQSDEASN